MAITVVFPAPVASLRASRPSPGLASWLARARWSRKPWPAFSFGATSVSQITVSTASTWQKNGRTPANSWWRQCWRSRAVSGVTPQWPGWRTARHWSTRRRRALMSGVGSYSWAAVERPTSAGIGSRACPGRRFSFRGRGTGVTNWAGRRASTSRPVG
jgi:hypothetical protein